MAAAADTLEEDHEEEDTDLPPPFIKDRRSDYPQALLLTLGIFRKDGELTDIDVMLSEGRKVACHKVLLAAASPYFRNALRYDHPASLDLTQSDGDVMEAILDYIYSGQLYVKYHLLYEFLNAADFLQMTDVKEECADYLGTTITPRLSLMFFPLAGKLGLSNLKNAAMDAITMYFPAIAEEEDFMNFDHEELREVFEQQRLQVESEDQVLDLLMRWTLHSAIDRIHHFERLLQFVKIPVCSDAILTCIGKTKKHEYQKMRQFITKRLRYLNGLKDTKPQSIPKRREAMQRESIFLVGGQEFRGGKPTKGIYHAELRPNRRRNFEHYTTLPWEEETVRFGVSFLPFGFVLTGGNQQEFSLDTTWLFHTYTRAWTPLPQMLTERDGHVSMSDGPGAVIVAGGSRSYTENVHRGVARTERLDSVDRLDVLDMKWERIGVVPAGQQVTTGAICGARLFLLDTQATGGTTTTTTAAPLLEYDLDIKFWQRRRPIPANNEKPGGRLITILDRLYFLGGGDSDSALWKYLEEDDAWTRLEPLPLSSLAIGAAIFWKGVLYHGGADTQEIDEYNLKTSEWLTFHKSKLKMPLLCRGHFFFAGAHY